MNLLAADLHTEMTADDVLRLLQVTAARFHVMADAVEQDLQQGSEGNDDGR